ncbi:hypothetical protein Rsub_08057 [Raphidocelis subcapitata]|uniref:Mog1p/PsbP-like protein n=1 Tax=Raphidocelis subcapitata TaxID=307507 RepID=A0A2V0P7T5_9CHLO|nr:hypothetical protein Rsub_08057 [Raphidocelis subcapitata]|eukprot:GBF95934.1 hypothetical protein Rsub_08057 [Raphidocelis subcapitata]
MAEAAEPLQTRSLFGGAMEMAMPARFLDVSDVRPVPDNQEVWSDPSSDQSVVVEILEHSAHVPDAEAGAFFFRDLAAESDAPAQQLEGCTSLAPGDVPGVPEASARVVARGWQAVSKEREPAAAANRVRIDLAALRLPGRGSDVLVVLSSGADAAPGSSAAAAAAAGAGRRAGAEGGGALLAAMLRTLAVRDYSLFGA